MGVTYRFLAIDSEYQRVIDWFSDRPERPTVVGTDSGVNIHFSAFGPLARTTAGQVDTKRSPLVNVFLPQLKRGILWTAGEIHILATPLKKQYPPLQRVSAALREWLREFGRVHPPVAPEN